MTAPLAGIRVLDLTSVLMGPYTTQILGDNGADVIKIEAPAGDTTRRLGPSRTPGMGPMFLHLNRNKRGLVLDLKKPAGRQAMLRLVAGADVLVSSMRPQAMQRLRLAYADVAAANARLIYCGVYGFGERGPYAGRAAYDDIVQAAVALPNLFVRAGGHEPRYAPTVIADRTGGLAAAYAVTMALFQRERTGQGQAIEVPMFEVLAHNILAEHLFGRTFDPPRGESGYARLLASDRRPYPTKDGHVCALVYTDEQWRRFFARIGRPELSRDPRFTNLSKRTANVAALYKLLADTLVGKTTAEWLQVFEELDIPATALNSIESLLDDRHLHAVNLVQPTVHPSEGAMWALGNPINWGDGQPPPMRPAPKLGEHSREILAEAGYDDAAIAELLRRGVTLAPADGT